MFLRQWVRKGANGKPDRVNLDIVESYRDENRKCKSRVVKHIGYLDEFKDLYEDPIAHFKEEAVRMTQEAKKAPVSVEFSVNLTEEVDSTKGFVKNYGHIAASRIYHELRIDEFLNKYQRSTKLQSNLNSVLRALTFSRIIQPASKMSSYQDVFSSLFDPVNFSDEFMYRSLGHLGNQCDNIQAWINDSVTELYGRDLSVATYDLSNYFYEIDNEDDFRKRGCSKEHRPQPITQMGLMQDKNRIPIRFDLYKGNTADSKTLIPAMDKNRKSLKLARLVLVADRGIISAANVGEMDASGNGYIFGMSVRKASEDFQAFVLDPSGYRALDKSGNSELESDDIGARYRIKSRTVDVTLSYQANGQKIVKTVRQKQVVFYSPKYAERSRMERNRATEKARNLIASGKYSDTNNFGVKKYIRSMMVNTDSGEVKEKDVKKVYEIDRERIEEESRLDGFYAIVTGETEKTDDEILGCYRELCHIEESFKITKSGISARPVFVSTEEHIRAHFLVCFIALVITRLLEMKLGWKYDALNIIKALRESEYAWMDRNYFVLTKTNPIIQELGEMMGFNPKLRYRTLESIKEDIASVKKVDSDTPKTRRRRVLNRDEKDRRMLRN